VTLIVADRGRVAMDVVVVTGDLLDQEVDVIVNAKVVQRA
jgi:hypothetical protein